MSEAIIKVEGIGKKYRIRHQQEERYTALRDVISNGVRGLFRPRRKRPGNALAAVEEFWALKDVSFEVGRGDVVGIIGRNGAGKSTLLKILSRITEPSEGRVELRGRVASLLEVGTGFHPELTGRENIYLNGAILGMSRVEIRRKFDEIVAFSEVEKFLDTPVKRYSSGMYVRLAFAVAAHMEPEILIIDEVLAVGDAEFQKKCLGKMGEVAQGGRTVLFVSHNMAAVQQLCPRSILLANGGLMGDGVTAQIVADYVERRASRSGRGQAISLNGGLTLEGASVDRQIIRSGDPAQIVFDFSASAPGQIHECTLNLFTPRGERVGIVDPREAGVAPFKYGAGRFRVSINITALPLVDGDYSVSLWLTSNEGSQMLGELADFAVAPPASPGGFVSYPAEIRGHVVLNATSAVHGAAPA